MPNFLNCSHDIRFDFSFGNLGRTHVAEEGPHLFGSSLSFGARGHLWQFLDFLRVEALQVAHGDDTHYRQTGPLDDLDFVALVHSANHFAKIVLSLTGGHYSENNFLVLQRTPPFPFWLANIG